MGFLLLLGLVVIVAAVAVAVILAMRRAAPRTAGREGEREAEAILDRRLATGEIDVAEYHELASALRSVRPAAGTRRAGQRA